MERRLALPAGDTEEQREPGAGKGQAKRKSPGRTAHAALGNVLHVISTTHLWNPGGFGHSYTKTTYLKYCLKCGHP